MNLVNRIFSTARHKAVIDGSDTYSHGQLKTNALKLAAGLSSEIGIEPGGRVVIIAHNSVEFLMTYLAILSMGAVAIPLDPHMGEAEMARDIAQVRPSLIIASNRELIPESYREAIRCIEFHSSQWRGFQKKKPMTPIERDGNDVAVMMMTSGSNFQARPAMLTHASLIANLEQASKLKELQLTKKDIVLAALPMYHIYGLHVVASFSLAHEATLIMTRTFDPIELATIIENVKVTIVPGVPILFDALAQHPQVTIDSLNRVRLFISGGAPMRSDVRSRFHERFGSHIAEGYGLTEASPMVAFTPNAKREGDIGTPLPGVHIDIRDSSGDVSLTGDAGQIVVKGDNVFAGYFGEREASAKVLDPGGWLYTGDIGVKHDDGSITLIERSSDVIVVHGFSVYPSEVESVLEESPLVRRAYVVGELNETSGESVLAYIAPHANLEVTDLREVRQAEKELIDLCAKSLARYKVPVRYEFVNDLAVTASSRPLRKSLRNALNNIGE